MPRVFLVLIIALTEPVVPLCLQWPLAQLFSYSLGSQRGPVLSLHFFKMSMQETDESSQELCQDTESSQELCQDTESSQLFLRVSRK